MAKYMFLTSDKEAYFPRLTKNNYRVTSNITATYNGIAHAAGVDQTWWWPAENFPGVYWPAHAGYEETLDCFIKAYGGQGYKLCIGHEFEAGVEKVAIYCDADGVPTHAARQLPSGRWTSKLGEWEDIEHNTLDALEDEQNQGLGYGFVKCVLSRPLSPAQ